MPKISMCCIGLVHAAGVQDDTLEIEDNGGKTEENPDVGLGEG